jgi:hypothetical protein
MVEKNLELVETQREPLPWDLPYPLSMRKKAFAIHREDLHGL